MKIFQISFVLIWISLLTYLDGYSQQNYIITSSPTIPPTVCGPISGKLLVNQGGSANVVQWEIGSLGSNGFNIESTVVTNQAYLDYALPASASKTYRVKLANAGGTFYTGLFTITTNTPASIGTLSSTSPLDYSLVANNVTLSVSSYSENLSWEVYEAGVWTNFYSTSPGNTCTINGLTQSKSFRAVAFSSAGHCSAISNVIAVNVWNPGTLNPTSDLIPTLPEGSNLTLSLVNNLGDIKQWEYSTDNGNTWGVVPLSKTSYTHQLNQTTKFRVLVDQGPLPDAYSNEVVINVIPYTSWDQPLISGENYIKKQQVRIPGITTSTAVDALSSSQKQQVTVYQDGLGRPIQQNIFQGSAGSSPKDIVTFSGFNRSGIKDTDYLPYISSQGDGVFRTSSVAEQASFYNNGTADRIADSAFPFAKSVFEKSPLGIPLEQGAPGEAWQPNGGHTQRADYSTNDANDVRLLNSDGTSSGFYSADELSVIKQTDEDGKKTQTFKDKAGRVILTRKQLDETINGTNTPWLETYYIYYTNGLIRYMISPKGVAALKANTWSLTQSIKDQFVYEFIYDNLGRLVEKKTPGQGWFYFCYDRLDRLALMQDPNTRSVGKWIFVKYDRAGRVIMNGLYSNTTYTTRAALQTNVIDPLYATDADKHYEIRGTASHGYSNQSFPTTATEVLTVNYYDTYDFDYNQSEDYAYTPQGLANENTPAATAFGKATGSKTLVLGTSNWLVSYLFYSVDGRLIQARNNNHLNPATIDNLTTMVYDFEGKVILKKTYHNAGSGRVTTILNRLAYDHMGRLTTIFQNNNNASTDQVIAQYKYNGLGQLVEKNLHCNTCGTTPTESQLADGSNFLQSVDYRFNIRGWLESINNARFANNDSNDDANDYFGMEYLYATTDAGISNTAYYNGNVSAMKWKAPGHPTTLDTDNQKVYTYSYDKANRFKTAVSKMNIAGNWSKEVNAINESILEYDLNGNIKRLQRNQRKHSLTSSGQSIAIGYNSDLIDDLTYSYNNTQDQLLQVTDAANKPEGFDNGASANNADYTYNADGGVTSDLNKGISNIAYNVIGKPATITFSNGKKLEYIYDATGNKLTQKTYDSTGVTPTLTTDYVSAFVYEKKAADANGILQFFSSPEGRVVNNNGVLEYQYAIADLQGNTRVLFSSVNPTKPAYTATFEDAVADGQTFKNVSTSNVYWVPKPLANNTPAGQYVLRMNSSYNPNNKGAGIGPAKSLSVYPGDVVNMEVYAYYEGGSGFGNTSQPLNTLITAVAGVLTTGMPPGEAARLSSGVSSAYSSFGAPSNQGDSKPTAFLNYILLDKNYKLLDMGWQPVPASANMAKQKIAFDPKKILEPGYLYVYLSYEGSGTNWVYFDDFKVTHTQTNVLQYNEYYPFGLTTSSSWTREAALGNNYLYNEGSELNLTTGWYEMPFRNYDPVLGRLTSVDPLATAYASISPYHYAANNPVSKNDPTGAYTVGGCNCPDQTDLSAQEYSKWYAREQMRNAGIDPIIQQYYLFNQSQNGQKQNTKVFMYSEVSGQIAYVNGEEVSRIESTKYWFEVEHIFSNQEEAQQDGYRARMSGEELAIFNTMTSTQKLAYLVNGDYAIEITKKLFDAHTLHNGKGDAFRHALFSALNSRDLGLDLAKRLGDAHELHQLETELGRKMDLYNNAIGRKIFTTLNSSRTGTGHFSTEGIVILVMQHVNLGLLREIGGDMVLMPTKAN